MRLLINAPFKTGDGNWDGTMSTSTYITSTRLGTASNSELSIMLSYALTCLVNTLFFVVANNNINSLWTSQLYKSPYPPFNAPFPRHKRLGDLASKDEDTIV